MTVTLEEIRKPCDSYALIHGPEAQVLFDMTIDLPEGSLIVELGSYEGYSSSVLASVADYRNLRLICVDPLVPYRDVDAVMWVTDKTLEAFKRNVLDVYKNVTWMGHKVTSNEAAEVIDEEISFIFIDAEHTYEACIQDCRNWLPKLKPGHCVTFHDINNVKFIGIKIAVEEYCVGWEEVNSVWNLKTFRKPR